MVLGKISVLFLIIDIEVVNFFFFLFLEDMIWIYDLVNSFLIFWIVNLNMGYINEDRMRIFFGWGSGMIFVVFGVFWLYDFC